MGLGFLGIEEGRKRGRFSKEKERKNAIRPSPGDKSHRLIPKKPAEAGSPAAATAYSFLEIALGTQQHLKYRLGFPSLNRARLQKGECNSPLPGFRQNERHLKR